MSDLRQFLKLPDQVHKGDFVVKLTEGISHPRELLPDYALTPEIVDCFDRALDLVGAAIRGKQNYAAYVHGSFGSGKSHFLAVLSLMLGNDPAPWERAELHPLRAKYDWTANAKVLRLHLHMVGAQSVEQKIFGEYLRRVQELHPQAPLPALFEDAALFDDAENLRQALGDAKFFDPMNAGQTAGWGDLAAAAHWDAASFARARASTDEAERARLFSALARSHFHAFAQGSAGYLDFDKGLDVLSKHAAALGYRAVVLFLDELILWLAARAGQIDWLKDETQKLAKLVERQSMGGGAPLVSFVARQRDIAELVGSQHAGAQSQALHDSLKFWDGRFDTIRLEDRNLPAIVEKRVVRAKDEAARKALDEAFAQLKAKLGQVEWQTLLGATGDERSFRQVYPFSPSLIDALVALSQTLQRERTALKVLMEMLVDHLHDFELGKVVPVGDLYDPLAGGDEPMDGSMRNRFKLAKRLYAGELLPAIQNLNGTTTPKECQRLRPDHPVAIGCSNCPQARCRDDNRLVKTLLLQALVPEAPVLANLTASKLVQLNWGTLKSPVPGAQMQMGLAHLRQLAAQVGKLDVGTEGHDPLVKIRLEGVDIKPIIEAARGFDNDGRRQRKLREILYAALKLPSNEATFSYAHDWRGTRRTGTVQFLNVRELSPAALAAEDDEDFKIVIDYPFDRQDHTPQEDESVVRSFLDAGRASATLVWLPSFLSQRVLRELGELVIIDELRANDALRGYVSHLRSDEQLLARGELDSLSNQKTQLIRRALQTAYGLTHDANVVDDSRKLEQHFHVLMAGITDRLGGLESVTFESAVEEAVQELLQRRYPRHPSFKEKVTPGKLQKALDLYQQLCESDGQRLNVEKGQEKDLDVPEKLGLVTVAGSSVTLRPTVFQEVERTLRARGIDAPTVGQLAGELNPNVRGLTDDVVDFLIRAYAMHGRRELTRDGQPLGPTARLPNDARLVQPRMPAATAWEKALRMANAVLSATIPGRALHPANLRSFAQKLDEALAIARKDGAGEIAGLLARWQPLTVEGPRATTAAAVAALLTALDVRDPVDQIEVLAAFEPRTSADAMGRHVREARKTAEALRDELAFLGLEGLRASEDVRAPGILDELSKVLAADQLNQDLAPALKQLALQAQALRPKARREEPPPGSVEANGDGLGSLEERVAQLRKEPGKWSWSLRITRKG